MLYIFNTDVFLIKKIDKKTEEKKNTAINMCASLCVVIFFFISLESIPRNRTAGSYGKFMFNFLINC